MILPLKPFKLLLILLFCFISSAANSAIDTFEFDNVAQEQLFHDLSKQLRCPKCQNQNIADSNAQLAKDLRNKTYELVKQGKSEEQIVDYMVARFGNFVRYDPPMTPATIFLWLGPLLFILLGFLFLYGQIKNQNRSDDKLDKEDDQRLAKILNKKTRFDNKRKKGSKQ
ncbi:MAG: cytochrome c-type biogenesis protein CcmH [Psychromonas sp.]|jgi:cytochrome c-type biogenesis protein CcmH|uniref:cytochrome c-type biogenesis protein n=1 Tax=Psychromonas sp. TaxID=1884585 RepID=UPI0039E71CA6